MRSIAFFNKHLGVSVAITFTLVVSAIYFYHHQTSLEKNQIYSSALQQNKQILMTRKVPEFKPAELMTAQEIYQYIHWTNATSCQFAVDFGFWVYSDSRASAPDGHKAICLDRDVGPVYGKCLVYSFGINNQWAFDDAMSQFQCQIYSFDPSMGVGEHNRSERIHFYNIGMDGEDHIHPTHKWKMKTVTSVYEMLKIHHGDKIIDVLKMDIEYSEWNAIPQMLRTGFLANKVKQLAVEIHFLPDDSLETFRHRARILQNLESMVSSHPEAGGFVRFSSRLNPWLKRPIDVLGGKEDYIGFELAWYNSRFYSNA